MVDRSSSSSRLRSRAAARKSKIATSLLIALLSCSWLLTACGDAATTATAVPTAASIVATATQPAAAPTNTQASAAPTDTQAAAAPTDTQAAAAPTNTAATTSTGQSSVTPPADQVTLTWMIPTQQKTTVGDSVAMQTVEKMFNVQFQFTEVAPGDQYNEKKKLAIASQSIPDLMSWTTENEANTYGPQGAFLEISGMLADKLPNLKKLLDADPLGKYNAFTTDDKLYTVPSYTILDAPIYDFSYVKSEFDAVGATDLSDWNKLYDAFVKLKQKYPDSYPFSFRGGDIGTYGLRLLFSQSFTEGQAGNATRQADDNMAFVPADGKYIYGPTAPGFEDGIKFLAKLYNEKLLDPEYPTVKMDSLEDRLKNKKTFMLADYVGGLAGVADVQDAVGNILFPLPIPAAPGKKQILGFRGAKTGTLGTVLNSQLSGEKLDRALQVLNYLYSDDFYNLLYWNPDVTVVKDGVKMYNTRDMYTKAAAVVDKYLPWSLVGSFQVNLQTSTEPGSAYADYVSNVLLNPANNDKYLAVPALPFTTEQSKQVSDLQSSLDDLYNSEIDGFITGKTSFDKWDGFISELKSRGSDQLVDIYNQVYTQYYKK